MTGLVEWSTLLWIVGAISGAFVFGVVIMWRVVSWMQGAFDSRDKANNLALQVIDARARLAEETLTKVVTANELYNAQHYVTKDGLADALQGVQKSIDRLAGLLDQLLVQAAGDAPLQPNKGRG